MTAQINYKGQIVTLTDELGLGGEAVVYGHDGLAFKVYHQPSPDRDAKLRDYMGSVPPHPRIKGPIDLTTDRNGSMVTVMHQLNPAAEKLRSYSVRSWRQTTLRTTRDVAQIFASALDTLQFVHKVAVWGDVNKYGLFALKEGGRYVADWVDADAIQFGKWPCYFINLQSADPLLLPIDFSKPNTYTAFNDYASLLILFLEAAILTKPYGGNHPAHDELSRIKNGIMVWDSGVTVPDMAMPIDLISDDLLHLLTRWFRQHAREELFADTFTNYEAELIECPHCQITYPRNRRSCPMCSTTVPVTAQTAKVKTIISVDGSILAWRIVGDDIYAVCRQRSLTELHNWRGRLATLPEGKDYHLADSPLIVFADGSTSDGLAADTFEGQVMVGASTQYHYRISGGAVRRAGYGNMGWKDKVILTVPSGKSFLVVDPSHDRTYGYTRAIIKQVAGTEVFYSHWITVGDNNYTATLLSLRSGEIVIETHAKFAHNSILVLRRTAYRGAEYVYLDEIDLEGQPLHRQVVSDWEEPLDTCAYMNAVVLRATNKGVVQFSLTSGNQRIFPGTDSWVSSGNYLAIYGDGLLIRKAGQIIYLIP